MENEKYFTRKATGLVRQISAFDGFVYNQSYINTGMILLYSFLFAAAFYPTGNIVLAIILGALIAIPTAFTHGMLAATFPRSGGEYVYNSRILTPAWGFASNWNITLWLFFYMGVACNWFSTYGLSPLFRFIGVNTKSAGFINISNWLSSPNGAFVIGTIILVTIAIFHCVRPLLAVHIQRWYFIFGVIGVIIIALALILSDSSSFRDSFNSYFSALTGTADGYAVVQKKAVDLGFGTMSVPLIATFVILYLPGNFFFWGNASTYIGGEIKHAKKSQLFSLPAAVVFTTILAILAVFAFMGTAGKEFIGSISYNSIISPQDSPTLIYSELGAIATNSLFWGIIALVGCSYWAIAFVLSILGAMTRNLLAWSLDRIMPKQLSDVHDRFHTPIKAIIVGAIACEIGLFLFTYVPAFAVMVGILGAFLTYMTTSLSAIFFPLRRKELFNLSPVKWHLFKKIPVISIFGVLSLIGLIVCVVSVLSDPFSGISISPSTDAGSGAGIPFRMFLLSIGIFASGFIIYWLIKLVQKKKGVDITLIYKEIPPE